VVEAPPFDANVLLSGNRIAAFSTLYPAGLSTPGAVLGLDTNDVLVGIDRRPINGMLYGLALDSITGAACTLYVINAQTRAANAVGSPFSFYTSTGALVSFPNASTSWSVDVDPAQDVLRVSTATGQNFRVNLNTGKPLDGDLGSLVPVNNVNLDGPTNGLSTAVHEVAYTNNTPLNGGITTLYTLDHNADKLFIQAPPNSGTQTVAVALSTPLDAVLGFDIAAGVNTATANTPVAAGQGFAIVRRTGQAAEELARVDLVTGQLSGLTPVGAGGIRGFAVQRQPSAPVVALGAGGTQLLRFSSAAPGTTTSVNITGVAGGETLVGLDFHSWTGQLFAFGVNATTDTGTLYLIDPQSGTATPLGPTGQVAFRNGAGALFDFPSASAAYGVNVDPISSRLRVTTPSGLTLRVNTFTGEPVDGNSPMANVNPDGTLSGAATDTTCVAYTNSYKQPSVATMYGVSVATQSLHVVNPYSGVAAAGIPLKLNGAAINFTAARGFDIQPDVLAPASDTAVTKGSGFVVLTANGVTSLYSVDLPTGALKLLGPIGTGTVVISGIAVARTSVD
jgi:hypothetical protein